MSDVDYQPPKKKSTILQKVSEFIAYLIGMIFLVAVFTGAIALCVKFLQVLWNWVF